MVEWFRSGSCALLGIGLALAVGMDVGCSKASPSADGDSTETVSVGVVVAGDKTAILGVGTRVDAFVPSPSAGPDDDDVISWELHDENDQVRASGTVAGGRTMYSEANGDTAQPTGAYVRSDIALVDLVVPNIGGELVFFDGAAASGTTTKTLHPLGAGTPTARVAIPKLSTSFFSRFLPASTITPTLIAGSCGAAVNILFLPEGFTQEELATYRAEVTSIAKGLVEQPGYAAHAGQMAIWTADVASPESGITDPGCTGTPGPPDFCPNGSMPAVSRSTAFGLAFGDGKTPARGSLDVRRCAFVTSQTMDYTKLALRFWARWQTRADATIFYVNEQELMGCGDPAGGWLSMSRYRYAETGAGTLAHELGHAIFGLADEYPDGALCTASSRKAAAQGGLNITANLKSLPWSDLVNTSEIPTTTADKSLIGAFEGAYYCATGVYRPQLSCKMNNSWTTQTFCAVCARQIDRVFASRASLRTSGASCGADAGAPGDASLDTATGTGKTGTIGIGQQPGLGSVAALFTEGSFESCTRTPGPVCDVVDCPNPVPPTSAIFHSAGSIVVSGGTLPPGLTLTPSAQNIYSAQTLPGPIFQGGEDFVAHATGADVPAFDLHGTAPMPAALTQPAIPASGPMTVDRGSPLALAWTGGTGTVMVTLSAARSPPTAGMLRFDCHFDAAAGTGTVPANLLGQLAASPPGANGPIPTGNFSASVVVITPTKVGDWTVAISVSDAMAAAGGVILL